MMHEPSQIKELFYRFMAGRCSPDEIEILITYLENAENEDSFPTVEEFKAAYPDFDSMDPAASRRVFRKLQESMVQKSVDSEAAATPVRAIRVRVRWISAAAAVILFAVVSVAIYLSLNKQVVFTTGNAEISHLELEDGTRVTLNANSSLQVRFSPEIREVWLDGEAFFRVAHDATKKFQVHTSDAFYVEVLGTEFNVKDRSEGTFVVLNKGSVKVNLQHDPDFTEELLIKPGEMVAYQPRGESLSKSVVDTVTYSSWKQNLLIFEETPLARVAQTIEHQFGSRVTFGSDTLAQLRFTGSSPANDLDMLLETLEKSFGFKISQSDQEIKISH